MDGCTHRVTTETDWDWRMHRDMSAFQRLAATPTESRRSWRAAAFLTLCVLEGLALGGCGKEEQVAATPPEVKVVTAVQKDVPIRREWVGQTMGAEDIEIRARVAGWLEGVHFKEGTEVKKGALLYTIDTRELEQEVAEARARLAQAKTLLVRAEADVSRYRPLAEAGAVSQRELEIALADFGARQSEVEAANASLRLAEINLGYARVTAPITGLIGISAARTGDYVGKVPNVVILNTISRVDSVHARFSITEQEYLTLVRRLRSEQAAVDSAGGEPATSPATRDLELTLADGSLYPHKGSVTFAQRQVDPATGTLMFEASFPNPDRLIRPGQFARIRAQVDERKGALVIPSRAITEMQGQYLAYTVGADNKVAMRRLTVGPKVDEFIIVEQGLSAGDKVIVEGLQRVRPDITVSPSEWITPDTTAREAGR